METDEREIKPIALSSSGSTRYDRPLSRTIDKDLSTAISVQTTSLEEGIWIRFELPKSSFVESVVVYLNFFTNSYNPNGSCMVSIEKYRKCKTSHNNTEVSVYQGDVKQKSCGTLYTTFGLDQSDQIYTIKCNVHGDKVVLTKQPIDTHSLLPLWEIVIFGTVPGL